MKPSQVEQDAALLEKVAKGFRSVVVRPKGNRIDQVQEARTRQQTFQDTADRLEAIAERLRTTDQP